MNDERKRSTASSSMSDTSHPAKRKRMEIPQQMLNMLAEKMAALYSRPLTYDSDGLADQGQVASVVAASVEVLSEIDESQSLSLPILSIIKAAQLVATLGKEDIDMLVSAVNTADWATVLSYVTATKLAWRTPYQGNTKELLLRYINTLNRDRIGEYQNFASIIQSSGTGKSRAVDEVARKVFTLPFNLRNPRDNTGYPESDEKVADFFCVPSLGWHDTYKIRYLLFLAELFEIVLKLFQTFKWEKTSCLAEQWHAFIKNTTRADIYGEVVTGAVSKFRDFSSKYPPATLEEKHFRETFDATRQMLQTTKEAAKGAASALVAAIETKRLEIDKKDLNDGDVRLLLYFDEAHCLHNIELTHWKMADAGTATSEERSGYYALCSALNELSPSAIFTLYLSTSSALAKFAPPKQHWSSARAPEVPWDLHPPFTELPFDIYDESEGLVKENTHTPSEVCRLEFMVRFGRPLFRTLKDHGANLQTIIDLAREKLLCGKDVTDTGLLAAISTRLMFDFEPRREEAMQLESKLVESHMRFVYSVPSHRLYMRTGSSSEPVLAEAAAQIMNGQGKSLPAMNRNDVLKKVAEWTDKDLFEKGELGELVARMLLTFAHDLAIENIQVKKPSETPFSTPIPVVEFIKALFQPKWAEDILASKPQNVYNGETFAEAFDGAYVQFTHFGRTYSRDELTDEGAFAAWCRGMGWTFHKTQEGVDISLPVFLAKLSKYLHRRAMTMLVFQIKNTTKGKRPHVDMDSPAYNFFSSYKSDDVDSRPYAVLVLNLGIQPASPHGSKTTTEKSSVSKPHTGASSAQNERSMATQSTPSKVHTAKGKSRETRQKDPIHPRYCINAFGCSSTVYRIVNEEAKATYAKILNSREMFAEHPRQEPEFIDQVLSQKPYFKKGRPGFGWVVPADSSDPSLSGRNSDANEASGMTPVDGVTCEEPTEEIED